MGWQPVRVLYHVLTTYPMLSSEDHNVMQGVGPGEAERAVQEGATGLRGPEGSQLAAGEQGHAPGEGQGGPG